MRAGAPGVLLDEVQVVPTDDNRPVHLGGPHNTYIDEEATVTFLLI